MSQTKEDMAKKPEARTVQEVFAEAVRLHRADDIEGAAKLYRLCLANQPSGAVTWTNYGALLRKNKNFEAAIACHRKALEIDPTNVNARSNLANALVDFGEAAEGIKLRQQLLKEFPDEWSRVRDLAVAYRACWKNQEAVDLVDEAEARLGPSEQGQLQRSLAHLMLGNYAEGFRDFEARYSGDEVALPKDVPWPRWTGEPLDGKKIVVLPEQGFGDAILMSRFLPQLKAMGAEVSMVVKKPLQRLMANMEGLDHQLPGASKSHPYDFYTPNMSLPHLVGMPDDGVPPPLPRLTIPDDSRARAQQIVRAHKNHFKIGIVWTGSLTYRANHRRSTGPESFVGLAQVPGVQLFSLYKGDAHEDFAKGSMNGLIMDACGRDRDFADTAAVIDEMDLMITTDTAVVHVAASLGKPIWNLLTWEGFWLYGDGETTPWYPSMRIFRQKSTGAWDELFQRVEVELRKHLETER